MMNKPEFERAERPDLDPRDRAIHRVADAVHRLNEAIHRAVNEGVSVELVRVSRHHGGNGSWGDQVVPTIRDSDRSLEDAA